jgi:uncharacterized protein YdeI (YjbR/CyaY-like superfamily)
MPGRNPRFETYFGKPREWGAELNALREILLACGLDEELKWRQPCYQFEGANVVILSSYKSGAALGFFKGSLLPDPNKMLQVPGPNSRAARMLRFTSVDEIADRTAAIKAMIRAAIAVEKSGAKIDLSANRHIDLPEELAAALNKDAALKKAWSALTPGRQRGWVIHFNGAKQSATRAARVAKAAPQIMAGEGMHDAYKKGRGG